jgi:hypothetical protein
MPTASGSIAFLGAARFQGYWNATTNHATGSGLVGAVSGKVVGLFATGSSTGGGYAGPTGLTASIGHYWQLTGSGAHNVNSHTNWRLNDWVIYSGSVSDLSNAKWTRLAYEDTIASIVVGDISGESVFNLTGSSNRHVLFVTGSEVVDVKDVVMSGSDNFTYDYNNNNLVLTGALIISSSAANTTDPITIYQGTDNDIIIKSVAHDGNTSWELVNAAGGDG